MRVTESLSPINRVATASEMGGRIKCAKANVYLLHDDFDKHSQLGTQ